MATYLNGKVVITRTKVGETFPRNGGTARPVYQYHAEHDGVTFTAPTEWEAYAAAIGVEQVFNRTTREWTFTTDHNTIKATMAATKTGR